MRDMGIGSWPARRARMVPGGLALVQGDQRLTYGQLAARVDRLAAGFRALGVQPGDRIAYLGPNDIATFETLFATAHLRAIFVPLNTRLAAPEIPKHLPQADVLPRNATGKLLRRQLRDRTRTEPTIGEDAT